ncbi:hypothetical protein [Streptomyces zhihengii]
MTDLSLEEQRLLPFVTVSLLRDRAVLRQEKLLVRPFPDCHECGQPVAEIAAQEAHFPTVKRWFALRPCGHRFEILEERLAQVREAATLAADEIENGPPGSTPDWLRGGACCVCEGQGGPVVYRNYRDQAFCGHCCDCDCRTTPCARPEETELTAEEARAEVERLTYELYQAQDALAFAAECCDIADREQRPITTVDVRTWLKGNRCGRQLLTDQQTKEQQ